MVYLHARIMEQMIIIKDDRPNSLVQQGSIPRIQHKLDKLGIDQSTFLHNRRARRGLSRSEPKILSWNLGLI